MTQSTESWLVILSGLPGSGKSTLAREIARRLSAFYVRIDTIEQALANCSLHINPPEDTGYATGYAISEDNLRLGRTVIADSVNPIPLTRDAWRNVAQLAGSVSIDIEVICSDRDEHKKRVETRLTDLPNLVLPTWQEVVERDYMPWNSERIIIDTAGKSVEACVNELLIQLPF